MIQSFTTKFLEYFDQETDEVPSLARFYLFDTEYFINYTPTSEYKSIWLNRFKKAASERNIKNIFQTLNPNKFWYLEATIPEPDEKRKSVEERIIKFALDCNYYHPSQHLILDLSDSNWTSVFTKEERKEIENANCKLLRPLSSALNQQLSELYRKKTAKEAYNFARQIEHDPEHDPIFAWLSSSLQNTALLFLKQNKFNIQNYLESDKMYHLWNFLNKIFDASKDIVALGSEEKSSSANAAATNQKRKLSAVEPVDNLKMGRRTDTSYIGGGDVELGCLEIGKASDQTKEFMDGSIKMPIVMRDMLLKLVEESQALVNELHTLGYVIMGNKISLLDMDIPGGYVTRIRRTKPKTYPNSSENFVVRIGPLLDLAVIGKAIVEDTYNKFSNTMVPLSGAEDQEEEHIIPPRIPVLLSSPFSPSSPSSSSHTSSSNKRRNTSEQTSTS
ncbi:hypothetical protein BDC45DRAFT_564895 [Circinella umbellata]|nr:hypothetical protein BDC45DRAFT_564895 [Circinella umbellata]